MNDTTNTITRRQMTYLTLGAATLALNSFYLPLTAAEPGNDIAAKPVKPNILWIIGEDMGPDLGCYGTAEVRTPNLDRLASEGARYTRAYATAPVCSPARSAFCTGMDQIFLGAHNHRGGRMPPLPDGVKLVSHWFRDGGYFTANVRGFPPGKGGICKEDWNFVRPVKPYESESWHDLKSHQPFYAQVNMWETHRPFHKRSRIDPAKVVFPPYVPDHPTARQDWANYLESMENLDKLIGEVLKQLDDDGLRDNTAVFFFGDNGRTMPRGKTFLFESGLHVPLIVRWPGHVKPGIVSDNLVSLIDLVPTALTVAGLPVPHDMHGQDFLGSGAKRRECLFGARDRIEESVDRVRCVITDRYQYIRNFMTDRPAMGRIRAKEKSNKGEYAPTWVLLQQLHAEGKLTPAQSYVFNVPRPSEELYDLQLDPHELHNLAESPEHQNILKEHRSLLDAWLIKTNDKGATPEDPAVIKAQEDRWIKTFGP